MEYPIVSIIKYYHHKGALSDLSDKFPAFKIFSHVKVNETPYNRWRDKTSGKMSHDFLISFFGKSGYGKSSTVNAFFGGDIMETSDTDACTRRCNCLDYEISDGNYLSLGDFPGIGESEYRNQEYLKMYGDFMDHVGVVVYIMRADARDHTIDEQAYKIIFNSQKNQQKVIIAINQCDKVEPCTRGNWENPTVEQMKNIQKKIDFLQRKFQPQNKIVPYSASTGWNMGVLAEEMVRVAMKSEGLIRGSSIIALERKFGASISSVQKNKLAKKLYEMRNYTPKVGVFGMTGVGKSSLCNALFGKDVCPISHVEACTREPQKVLLELGESGLQLVDMPGAGETRERDNECDEFCQSLLPELDLILFVFRCDSRSTAWDKEFYKRIIRRCVEAGKPFLAVINQVDLIEPFREWDEEEKKPGLKQLSNIEAKRKSIAGLLGIPMSKVIAISAWERYGLVELVDSIVHELPNGK